MFSLSMTVKSTNPAHYSMRICMILVALLSISACNLSTSPTVQRTATPFPLDYNVLGHVLTSDNWAGYVLTGTLPARSLQRNQRGRLNNTNGVADVSAQWTVPTVTCGKTDSSSAVWVGIDG